MANIDVSKIKLPNDTNTYHFKDNSQQNSDHRHYEKDIVPLVHKKYESTGYYATSATQEDATWYFIAVKPDSWYLPWRVDFKVRSYCPNYLNCDSITWSTVCGREQGLIYANWNERYDTGHYYISAVSMKKAGFDAGYSHAIGVSILYGANYTTGSYYRTFEFDYLKCENCTVTILDTPTKLAGWTGYSTTNFNGVSNFDAVTRGLRESGDDNDGHYYARRIYSDIKAGSNKIFPYTFIMQNADGRWESIVTSSSTGTNKSKNPHGFLLGEIMYMSANATYNENAVVGTYCVNEFFGNLLDHRYSFNTANNATDGTIANKPVYIVGTIGSDGLFYLANKWWAQDLPATEDGLLYMYIGDPYDYYRMEFALNHPIYWYKNGAIRQFTQDAATVNGLTVQTAVPANAKFTDTTYTGTGAISVNSSTHVISTTAEANQNAFSNVKVGSTTIAADSKTDTLELVAGSNVTLIPDATNDKVTIAATDTNTTYTFANGTNGFTVTPSDGTAQTVTVTPSITNNITGSGTNGYIAKFNGANTITNAVALGSDTTKYLRNDGTWQVPSYPIVNNATLTIQKNGTNVQTFTANQSTNATANITVPTKTSELTNNSNFVTSDNAAPYEAKLRWGGQNFSASYGCIDAAMVSDLNANRFSFLKAAGITIEYTRDGGSTWIDYGATDTQKTGLFNPGTNFVIGKADSTNKATANGTNYQLRVTINTASASIYTELKKIIIYCSTSGSAECKCQISGTLKPATTYTNITDPISIGGWSGYNVIQVSFIAGNSFNGQYNNIRFLFTANGGDTTYNGLVISQILGFGGVGWGTPSTMAKTGHLYSYDASQNATFPASITASNIAMPLSAGKITGLTAGTTKIFKDGIGISNPATANDVGWIRVTGTGESDTILELATGDDGGTGEQIVVRQYNISNVVAREAKLLDTSGNTTFPNNVTATKFIGALQGNADTASKLGTSTVGSTTTPIYLNAGVPTALSYTIAKSVPSDAVFTDTQANWTQTTSTALDYIKNKPTLGTASAKDVPASGNASTSQVVLGSDTRLSNARTPTSHTHGNIQNGGTLQTNDITIATGDKLVVTDSSDSNKIARTSVSFDGSTATKCLTQKGTWENFTNNSGTVTGTGTSGYLTKWNGTNSITNGPQLGSSTTTYLRNDGSWATPTDTNNAVTQTITDSTNSDFKLLMSETADSTTRTEGARKSTYLSYNPSENCLNVTGGTIECNTVNCQDALTPLAVTGEYNSLANLNSVWWMASKTDNPPSVGNSNTTLTKVTLSAGLWLVIGAAYFDSNTTGTRWLFATDNGTSDGGIGQAINIAARVSTPAASIGTGLNMNFLYNTDGNEKLYFKARQNSGTNLGCQYQFFAIKLNNSISPTGFIN